MRHIVRLSVQSQAETGKGVPSGNTQSPAWWSQLIDQPGARTPMNHFLLRKLRHVILVLSSLKNIFFELYSAR